MTVLEATVEVTKAALPLGSGSWINDPEKVAQFMDVVHTKLRELDLKKYK